MRLALAPEAETDRDRYIFHIWADDPAAALAELDRLEHELVRFASLRIDGAPTPLEGWPRPVRRHYIHPFHVFYERRPGALFVVRLYHHARRPLGT